LAITLRGLILFGGVRGRGIFDEEGRASKLRDIFK